MSAIRLYMDEDSMSHSLVRALRARGVDVTTALEEGMIERGDAEHLDHATAQGRVLYGISCSGQEPRWNNPGTSTAVFYRTADAMFAEAYRYKIGRRDEKQGGVP